MGTLYLTDGDDLTSVADAIRAKSGGSSQLAFPAGFVSEIQAIPSGGGGGGGLTLLATGERTLTAEAANMTIPVSYAGTAKYIYVIAETEKTNGGTWAWFRADENVVGSNSPVFCSLRYGTSTTGFGGSSQISFSATQIVVPRANSTNQIKAQKYLWYIYGEATS